MSSLYEHDTQATIIENARIYTLDHANPGATALAWRNGRIAAVGTPEEMRAAVGDAVSIDLGGATVIPGLIDAHIHCLAYSQSLQRVNLDGITSKDEALRVVAEKVAQSKPGEWVVGGGWNNNLWSPPTFPTKEELDRIAPHNPVYLDRKDLHSCWVNSKAVEAAGITRDTPVPPGSAIGKDEAGEPNGLFYESAVALMRRAIKEPAQNPIDVMREGMKALSALGLVGLHNAQGQDRQADSEGQAAFRALQDLDRAGELPMRVVIMIPHYDLQSVIAYGLRTGFGTERLRIGPVKMFSDGSLGSMTAELLAPYEGRPGYTGIRTIPQGEIEESLLAATAAGIPSAIHAIGDAANRRVLDAFKKARELEAAMNDGRTTLVHRIEHAQLLSPEDVARFAALGVAASMQPLHATSDMHAADRLWGERSRYAYAWRSLLDSGAVLAFGSDAPVEVPDPFAGIHAAVTRQDANDQPPGGWYPEERLTVEEALRAYTEGAARSAPYLPGVTGTLCPGSVADMLVLEHDIFAVDLSEIKNMRPLATLVGGEPTHDPQSIFGG